MKIGIYFGSTTGNTRFIAESIGARFVASENEVCVKNVAETEPSELTDYDLLLLGSSTWGVGELQDDWDEFLPKMSGLDFSGKKVALFGVGDQSGWADTFVDAVGIIYEEMVRLGAVIVGGCSIAGYDFSCSRAVVDGSFVGMAFDQDNQSDLTMARISAWIDRLQNQFS